MSDPASTEPPPPPPQPPGGCLTALMLLAGILLLLPGLCSLVVGGVLVADWQSNRSYLDASIFGLFAITFAISAVGILLIRAAIRGPRR